VNLQDIISNLNDYWAARGCVILQPYDVEKGSATVHPATFFGTLGAKPLRAAYVDHCRRPKDGRYSIDPRRLGGFYQYQVLIKPPPADIRQAYLDSLDLAGINTSARDIRWIEGDWTCPPLGAYGFGWEIQVEGLEVTHFTYLQHMASFELRPASVEIAYGLERLALCAQKKKNIFDLQWDDRLTYGQRFKAAEEQFSRYSFEETDVQALLRNLEVLEKESLSLAQRGHYLPAYDLALKFISDYYLLQARNTIPDSEKDSLVRRAGALTRACAAAYIKDNEPVQEHKSTGTQEHK